MIDILGYFIFCCCMPHFANSTPSPITLGGFAYSPRKASCDRTVSANRHKSLQLGTLVWLHWRRFLNCREIFAARTTVPHGSSGFRTLPAPLQRQPSVNPFIPTVPYPGHTSGFVSFTLAVCNFGILLKNFLLGEKKKKKKRWLSISPCCFLEKATVCENRMAFCTRVLC